jgi:DNA-binding NarL/FixJ family response regulator
VLTTFDDDHVHPALNTGACGFLAKDVGPAELLDGIRRAVAGVGEGLSDGQIGERLHVGVTTVKTHMANIMTRTRCDNRVRLAVLAVRLDLVG